MPKVFAALPILATTDLAASVAYFVDVLGFSNPWTVDREGKAFYAGATLDGADVHFSAVEKGTDEMQAYIHLEDVDAYAAELSSRGVANTTPEDRSYGMRDFQVIAPGQVTIGFGSNLKS